MADAFWPPAGPVSTARAAPLGAKASAKTPGPALGLITIGDKVPFFCTLNASMLFVSLSVTSRNRPLGLKANDEAPEVLVLRKVREWGIGWSLLSWLNRNPITLLLPPVLRT